MSVGSQSDCVKSLQNNLAALGVGIQIDGKFGEQTRKAVVAFQESQGLAPDGIVGPLTRDRLDKVANSPEALGPPNPVTVGPAQSDGTVLEGGVLDCGNLFGTCSFYIDRPTTKEVAQAFDDQEVAIGGAQISVCHRISQGKGARVSLACDVAMLLGGDKVKKTAKAAADGNGCLRVRWTQDPMFPVGVYNDGGRHCTG
jgi:peptidoglycan hydrolase-like protein with peptidoglycan-binding domain